MTTSLGGVHVDATLSLAGLGPTISEEMRKLGRRAGDDADREFGTAGRRGGDSFSRNFAEVVNRESRSWAGPIGRALVTALGDSNAFGRAVTAIMSKAGRDAEEELGEGIRRGADGRLRDARGRFVDEGNRAGAGFARGFSRGLSVSLSGVGSLVASIGRTLAGVVAAAGAAVGAGGLAALASPALLAGIAALGSELSQLGGVLGLIPAAAVGAGLAIGTLVIGFQGIGDAIKADDLEAWNEALANLAPNARATAVAVKGFADEARNLRLSVQDALFEGMADTIERLGGTYLPIAERGFTGLASQINSVAQAFAEFALDPQTIGDTEEIFNRIGQAIQQLRPGIISFSEAFRDIITVGSRFLPEVAAGFSEIGRRFADFIAEARDSGALEEFFRNALDAARDLFAIFGNVGSALVSVFQAVNASGINILGTIRNLTGQLATFLNSAAGQESLANFFASAQEAAAALTPIIHELFNVFSQQLAPILFEVGTTLAPAITEIVAGLGSALEAAGPGIENFARGFAQFLTAMAPAAESIGRLAGTLGTVLGRVLSEIGPELSELVTLLADNLADALSNPALINGITSIASLFGRVIEIIAPLLPDLADLAGRILVMLADALGPIVEALLPPLVSLFEALAPVLEPVIDLLGFLLELLTPIFEVIGFLIDVVKELVDVFVSAAEGIGDLTDTAMAFLFNVGRESTLTQSKIIEFGDEGEKSFRKFGAGADSAWFQVKAFSDNTIGAVGSAAGVVVERTSWMTNASTQKLRELQEAAKAAFGAITTEARKEMERTKQTAANAIADVRAIINNADFGAAGAGLMQSLANGMNSKIGELRETARRAVEAIAAYLPRSPAETGPFSGSGWTPYRGQALAEGFAEGILSRLRLVADAASLLAGSASDALFPTITTGGGGGGRGTYPVMGGSAARYGAVSTTHKTVHVEQHVHVPASDPSTFAALSGAHMRAAASKVM